MPFSTGGGSGEPAVSFRHYHINRPFGIQGTAPTAGETPDLPDLATATVWQSQRWEELWSYTLAGGWVLTSTIDNLAS